MSKEQEPTRQQIEQMLAILNDAQIAFYTSRNRIEKNTADMTFQDTWDWFRDRGIKIEQNRVTKVWTVEERLTLYIGRNTYTALLAELQQHQVVIQDSGDRLKAIFPEGTRRTLHPEIPGAFTLILPDGWVIQELELRRSNIPYTSILVYGPDQPISEEPGHGVLWKIGQLERQKNQGMG